VVGIATDQGNFGVLGGCSDGAIGLATGQGSYGVLAQAKDSATGALKAEALNNGDAIYATTSGNGSAGVFTAGGTGYAVYGSGQKAAEFIGSVDITGHLTVSSCTGCAPVAHPAADVSSSVQSGNAVTDSRGYAVVRVPASFWSQVGDFRYQLTAMGHNAWGAPLVLWNKLRNGAFTIRSRPHVEVSWEVTGTPKR
jgi:hypothetical protein